MAKSEEILMLRHPTLTPTTLDMITELQESPDSIHWYILPRAEPPQGTRNFRQRTRISEDLDALPATASLVAYLSTSK